MSHLEVPRFPRGFLLADRPVEAPPGFVSGPLIPNFYVHSWTNLEVAGDDELFVLVIGHCVATRQDTRLAPADELLAELKAGQGKFLEALSDYSGRHAIIFGSRADVHVVNDATGMRSVFYAAEGGVVASHATLVEYALGGKAEKDDLVFVYGYPGNRTPYGRTRILTPNTTYWLTGHKVRRFWPFTAPIERTVDSVAEEALAAASTALRNISRTGPVKMALTAGLDSRVILAVGLHSGVEFETYTYGEHKATIIDRAFASDLAAHANVPHTLIPPTKDPQGLRARLREANYSPHHVAAVGGLMHFYDDPNTIAVTGNLLEIGRSFYKPHRNRGIDAPVNGQSMAELHRQSAPPRVQERHEEYGLERFTAITEQAFAGFVADTDYDLTTGLLDPFDQFYWEHRMGTWHGPAMAERDFYGVAFIPFNSRSIFEAMLGVSQADRDKSAVFYRMIEMVDPSLLSMPVNPKKWPQTSPAQV